MDEIFLNLKRTPDRWRGCETHSNVFTVFYRLHPSIHVQVAHTASRPGKAELWEVTWNMSHESEQKLGNFQHTHRCVVWLDSAVVGHVGTGRAGLPSPESQQADFTDVT